MRHLGDVIARHGPIAGATAIGDLLRKGLELEQAQRAEEKGPKRNVWATDLGKCEREIYFSLTGEPETNPLTPETLINFKVGNSVEDAMAELLASATGGQVVRQLRYELQHRTTTVSGRLDLAVLIPEARSIVEVKSLSSRWMGYMVKNRLEGDPRHRKQLNWYLHASHEVDPTLEGETFKTEPFELGYLLYLVKDATKGERPDHTFVVPYNEAVALQDLEWQHLQQERADRGEDPGIPPGFRRSKVPCSYCSFAKRCWG